MRIYLSGIAGVGIGPLAMIAQDIGHQIVGSDPKPSYMTEQLEKRGVKIDTNQSGEFLKTEHNLQPIDLYVYTAALKPDHPELITAGQLGIKVVKRHELLNQIIKQKDLKLIAISGTHGKTTATAMLIWLFKQLAIPCSHLVGTDLTFAGPAGYQPDSQYFIYEADEFDKNMLKFEPYVALINTVDYDHVDTYPSPQQYREAFAQFAAQSQNTYIWDEDAVKCGLKPNSNLHILERNRFSGPAPNSLGLRLAGEHSRLNASLVAMLATDLLKVPLEQTVEHLNSYPGSGRRFEKISQNLYSDYAHHPKEIAATIQLARELSDNVVVVYQPHQNVRQNQLIQSGGYGKAFEGAKSIYWLPTFLSRESVELEVLAPKQLIDSLSNPYAAEAAEMNSQLASQIKHHLENGDLVVAMSAGDLDSWLRQNFTED